MPWWGWLIIVVVGMVCVTYLLVATIAGRLFRKFTKDMDTDREEWRRKHGFLR